MFYIVSSVIFPSKDHKTLAAARVTAKREAKRLSKEVEGKTHGVTIDKYNTRTYDERVLEYWWFVKGKYHCKKYTKKDWS